MTLSLHSLGIPVLIATVLLLVVALRVLMSGHGARKAATALGFTAEDIERVTPTLDDHKQLLSLDKDKCVKYSTSKFPGRMGDWSMLQRFPETGVVLPNGFIIEANDVTPMLIQKLKPLADTFGYDYFEFERKGDTLSVFWWESGGRDTVEKLHRAFAALDGA